MLTETIRILNFDDSLTQQHNFIQRYKPEIINLKNLGPASRLWCNHRTERAIRDVLKPQNKNAITFLGSGDFHHVSRLLIDQFDEPLTLFIFDHHPDWDMLPPRGACGSWVTGVLQNLTVKKIVLCGVSSEDISSQWIHSGYLRALAGDRLEIYPYAHRPTRIYKHVPPNKSIHIEKKYICKDIYWQELQNRDLEDFMLQLFSRLETRNVYISIDKDCLKSAYALTNWEEGCLDLHELLLMLRLIKENMNLCGIDITGDYSVPEIKGWIKTICSNIDHPGNYTACGKTISCINSINEKTNMKILEVLQH